MCENCQNNCCQCNLNVPVGPKGDTGVGISNVQLINEELIVTLTNNTIFNLGDIVGGNGQSIDHVSLTSGTGTPGTTDTYTVWGDLGETINLGTFTVYNGANGIDGTNGDDAIGIDTINFVNNELIITLTDSSIINVDLSTLDERGNILKDVAIFNPFDSFSTPIETRTLIGDIELEPIDNNTFYKITIMGKLAHNGQPKPLLELQLDDTINNETIGLILNNYAETVDFKVEINLYKFGNVYFYSIDGKLGAIFQLLSGGSPHTSLFNSKWNPNAFDVNSNNLVKLNFNAITYPTTGIIPAAIQIRYCTIEHIKP